MAKKKWTVLPGGRIKRWKRSESESGSRNFEGAPGKFIRIHLNRKERRRSISAISKGKEANCLFVHQHTADWY